MTETYTVQRLLALRKLTRSIAELMRGQVRAYLATLAPLFRPRAVLGEYVEGRPGEGAKGAEAAFRELTTLYEAVTAAKAFDVRKELKTPLQVQSVNLELSPLEYTHAARGGGGDKTVWVTSPLKWVLSYEGASPARLKEILQDRGRSQEEAQRILLHLLMLHVVVARQAGLVQTLEALRFPISSHPDAALGNLPVVVISSAVSTVCPPDEVLIESTEISGRDSFEEVVNVADVVSLRDPLRERLMDVLKSHGENV